MSGRRRRQAGLETITAFGYAPDVPPDQLTSAGDQLLQAGLLGTFVLIFGVVIVWLYREGRTERTAMMLQISDLQKERVKDAQFHRDQLVEVIRQCTTALTSVTTTLEGQKDAMMELRDAFREVAGEMREMRSTPGRSPAATRAGK